jgi:hypothetical protein
VLMQLDVGAIDVPQFAGGVPGQERQHPRPQPAFAPTPPARVNRTPRTKLDWHVAPRTTRAQHIPNGCHYRAILLRRSAPNCAILPSPRFAPAQVNFFSRFHSGSGNSVRAMNLMTRPAIPTAELCSQRFENTP